MRARSVQRGFSLVELLVVIAVIGMLVAILLPAVQSARETARGMQCLNNLKQMGLGLHAYHAAHNAFPPGLVSRLADPNWQYQVGNTNSFPKDLGPGWSFFALLLPYVGQTSIYNSIDFNQLIADPVNEVPRRTKVALYVCPSDAGFRIIKVTTCGDPPASASGPLQLTDAAMASYVGSLGGGNSLDPNYGAYENQPFNGVFHRNFSVRIQDITDGTSNTIGIGERQSRFVESSWVGVVPGQNPVYNQQQPPKPNFNPPSNPPCHQWRPPITAILVHARSGAPNSPTGSPASFHGPHPGGCKFLLMDGSTRVIDDEVGLPVFQALCTRNGGEIVSAL